MKTPLALLLCSFLGTLSAQAQLIFEKIDQKLEGKPGQEVFEAVFPFKNTGPGPVQIVKLKSSCGCTVAEQDKKVYAPGETGKVTAQFRPGSRTGHQEKVVEVNTDAPGQTATFLKVIVDIPKALVLEPPTLRWNKNDGLEPKKIRVKAHKEASIKTITVESSSPQIKAEVKPIEDKGENWEITVTPIEAAQSIRAVVTIRTDWPQNSPRLFSSFVAVDR